MVKVLASYLARNSSFLAYVGEWMDLCEALDSGAAKEGYAGWWAERKGSHDFAAAALRAVPGWPIIVFRGITNVR